MKTHFALLLPSLAHGGAQKVFLDCGEYLQSNYGNIIMIVLDQEGDLLKNIPKELNVKFLDHGIKRNGLYKRIIQLIRLRKKIKKYEVTNVLSTVTGMNICTLLCFYFSKNISITIREATSLENSSSRIALFLMKFLYPRADKIICTSEYICEQLVDLNKALIDRVIFLPNPINICKIRHQSKEPYEPLWGEHNYRVISVGRLVEAKGYDVLIKAMAIVTKKIDCQLVIIGDGPERKYLERLIEKLALKHYIKLIGYKNNPYPYIASANLFVLSSRWEGYVNTVLEAMALGVAVVATDCKSGPGELLKKELAYELVPVESPIELADSIENSLKNRKDTSLFEDLLKEHSIEIAIQNYIK